MGIFRYVQTHQYIVVIHNLFVQIGDNQLIPPQIPHG